MGILLFLSELILDVVAPVVDIVTWAEYGGRQNKMNRKCRNGCSYRQSKHSLDIVLKLEVDLQYLAISTATFETF